MMSCKKTLEIGTELVIGFCMGTDQLAYDELSSTGSVPRLRAADASVRLSRLLWNIDWAEWLPRSITQDGLMLEISSIESALPFISAHYAEIFHQDLERDQLFSEPFDGSKLRYYRTADVFEIKDEGRTVAVLIGGPSDWSTYYLRTMGALPEYHGRHLPRLIFPFLFGHLAHAGVRRVETETSPSNLAAVRFLTRLQFNITGTVLSERWGALVRLTKFLDGAAEKTFLDKFCTGIRYQQQHRLNKLTTHK